MSTGGDMYKAILKEIGAEESYMEYLFEESDDEDNERDDDHEGDINNLLGDFVRRDATINQVSGQTPSKDITSGDDNLLNHWESETEESGIDDPNKISREEDNVQTSTSTQSSDEQNSSFDQLPTWRQMLQVNNAKQEKILNQMMNLQQAQRESSPRNKMKRLMMSPEIEPERETIVLKEISDNDPSLNSSIVSSNTVQQISTRNTRLQGQWQAQQAKSKKLQDKITVMQAELYDQEEQWKKEKEELFSPVRSPSKIPKFHSSTMTPNGSVAETHTISPRNLLSSDNASSEELELSKALILQLEAQLEESRKVQQSQKDELRDCKDRLKKRDVEHKALLLRYETEKKSWQDECKEKQTQYHQELQSRDADLEGTRQDLQRQIVMNHDLREKQKELEQLTPNTVGLKEELIAIQNQMKSEMEENQKQSAYIQELEEENQRLRTDFTRKKDLETTQDEIKQQMKTAIEEQTKKTREFQTRIRELEGRHAQELEYWKGEVDNHRTQMELNSTRMESQLEEANARFANLERKHDKEVKEWQMLLDADITKAVNGESGYDDESQENLLVIGAGSTGAEELSPIRKAPQENAESSSSEDLKNRPNDSMHMIDDLLHELGEMDLERTAILQEIKADHDNSHIENVHIGEKTDGSFANRNSSTMSGPKAIFDIDSDVEEENPKSVESPVNSSNDEERKSADESNATNDSEVLDETLHLLNNLKTMLTSQENVKEHETTVLERLEVLSELMQSQEQSNLELTPAKPSVIETRGGSDINETSMVILASQGNAKDTSWDSAVEATAGTNPWASLVVELKSRCEFLERDRDEVTRITEQILEMERASHKAELEAAVAAVERKANENLHRIQLESNREMNAFYQNICFQCQDEAFDYSDIMEEKIDQ